MPLKCLSPSGDIYSFALAAEEWATLRSNNQRDKQLRMSCCNEEVVLKTSKLGTQFFAHKRRGTCTTAPESAEHLRCKEIVARAAIEAGWQAMTEVSGRTPTGIPWRADVLCTKNNAKVALEIQWSRQTQEDTSTRQGIYRDAGVRGMWFFRQLDIPMSRETPAVQIEFVDDVPTVSLPSPHYSADYISPRNNAPHYWGQRVSLHEFVKGALTGRLQFAPMRSHESAPTAVYAAQTTCWKCKEPIWIITRFEILANRLYPEHSNFSVRFGEIESAFDDAVGWANRFLPSTTLSKLGIGAVKPRYSRTMRSEYLSNGCYHCDALQGMFYQHEVEGGDVPVFEIEISITESLIEAAHLAHHLDLWWFAPANLPTEIRSE